MGWPAARTELEEPILVVDAMQCVKGLGQGGCGLTRAPGTAMGRPLTNTELTPDKIIPPLVLASPFLCTDRPMCYPMIIFLSGILIPVVASKYLLRTLSSVGA